MTHTIEMLAKCDTNPDIAKADPRFMPLDRGPLQFADPQPYLFPVNVVLNTPDGPNETWVYRVAALSGEDARDIVSRAVINSDLNVIRILVLPALPGGFEFVGSRVMQ
jgi:hypothetical protein